MSAKPSLLTGGVGSQIIKMAVPLLGGIYAMTAFTLADTYFVSRLGTQALAAISFTFPITMVLIYFILGVGVGTASVVARSIGAGKAAQSKRLATDGLLLGLVFVMFEVVVGLRTMDPLFRFLGAGQDVIVLIWDYMSVWYVAIGFFVLAMISNNIIRASGDAKFPSIVMMCSALLNLILDPIFIFGHFGCPAMGIKGAAVATLIAFILTAGVLLIQQARQYQLITWTMPSFKELLISWKRILHVGLPSGLTNMITYFAIVLVVRLLAQFGDKAVAGFGIALRIEDLALAVFHALGAALSAFGGQNWGAQLYDRVYQGLMYCFKICIVTGFLLVAGLIFFGEDAALIFNDDPSVAAYVYLYLLMVPVSYGLKGVVMMTTTSLNAFGRPLSATGISMIQTFGIYVPIAYLLQSRFGVMGIFIAGLTANSLTGFLSYAWIQKFFVGKVRSV